MDQNELLQQTLAQLRAAGKTIETLAASLPQPAIEIPTPQFGQAKSTLTDPYSTHAATLLAQISPLVQARRSEIATYFYNNLRNESELILHQLTSEELEHLKEMQMRYLEKLMSPKLSAIQHKETALQAGARHDAVSLPPEELTLAYQVYRHAIYLHIPELTTDYPEVAQIIEQRLNQDLGWQLMGTMQALEARNHHLKLLSEQIASHINRDDLLADVLESLRELPGIVGASVAAFAGENRLFCEKAVGLVLHGQECTLDSNRLLRDEPLLQAWREERPIWLNSVTREVEDSCMLADAQQLGIRSYAIIPVRDTNEAPTLLLIVYSEWPGFFLTQDKKFYFETLARSLSQQVNHIETAYHHHFANLTLQERQHYRTLLDEGKVEMVYQPIVDPRTHQVIKLESLARLIDEDDKVIAPYFFLAAFGTNQLLALFEQGLQQACTTLLDLHNQGETQIGISINLPTEAFNHPQVLYRIYATVHSFNLPPHKIALEILESGALDEGKAIQGIKKLKEHGFSIVMDDVGSGESSMLRMKNLPLDEIKVDQGFVRPLLNQLDHLDYVDTLVRLAENINLFCVVEGVEDENIVDMISTLGSAYLQGYGIAKPLPKHQLLDWIRQYQATAQETIDMKKGYQPKTLYGWYARHLKRARLIMDALPNNVDLLNFDIAAHWEQCPMTNGLGEMGFKGHPIEETHQMFHDVVGELRQKLEEGQEPMQLKKQLAQVLQIMRQQIEDHHREQTQENT